MEVTLLFLSAPLVLGVTLDPGQTVSGPTKPTLDPGQTVSGPIGPTLDPGQTVSGPPVLLHTLPKLSPDSSDLLRTHQTPGLCPRVSALTESSVSE